MGRGVSTPSNTVAVCYKDISEFEEGGMDWEFMIEDIQQTLQSQYPSLQECDTWIGREDKAILENSFCYVGVSKYCGLASIWVSVKECEYPALLNRWIEGFKVKFQKDFEELIKIGTFSNGESVYKRKGA